MVAVRTAGSLPMAFAVGAGIGILGGMIGLGGAEFRLPLLIGILGFVALWAVILIKAMSLLVVLTALPARLSSIPYATLAPYWYVALNHLSPAASSVRGSARRGPPGCTAPPSTGSSLRCWS